MIQPTKIPLSLLDKNTGQIVGVPANPRRWSDDEVAELAESIRETEVLMNARPLMVFPLGGRYIVIDGNMRLDALRSMKKESALCFIIPESTPPIA